MPYSYKSNNFQNWKKALENNSGLAKHNDCNSHKKAAEDLMKVSDYGINDVGELLDGQIITTAAKNPKVITEDLGEYLFSYKAAFTALWKLVK